MPEAFQSPKIGQAAVAPGCPIVCTVSSCPSANSPSTTISRVWGSKRAGVAAPPAVGQASGITAVLLVSRTCRLRQVSGSSRGTLSEQIQSAAGGVEKADRLRVAVEIAGQRQEARVDPQLDGEQHGIAARRRALEDQAVAAEIAGRAGVLQRAAADLGDSVPRRRHHAAAGSHGDRGAVVLHQMDPQRSGRRLGGRRQRQKDGEERPHSESFYVFHHEFSQLNAKKAGRERPAFSAEEFPVREYT